MRNLKKILSLALALVMVFSLMTFVSAREFNDAADIEHSEAVEVMSSLGVINGKGNNTFDPKGNVTRAEMAKMITYISLGNVEPTAFLGTTTNLTDITGHWAEAYIKYCYSQGIISGRGNGIFDPNANVTATEAARMLLVAIGYNADVQVYTGSQWNINVVRDAQLSHLYDDVSVTSTEVLNRDKAAQMMYNALNANTIVKSSQVDRVTGDITDIYTANGPTLLAKSYNAQVWIGTFIGNHDFRSEGSPLAGEIVVKGIIEGATKSNGDPADPFAATFPFDYDIANIGEEVKVIFKDGTSGRKNQPDKQDTIYGVYKTGGTTVVTGTMGDVKDRKIDRAQININGTNYDLNETVDSGKVVTVWTNFATYKNYTLSAVKGNSSNNSTLTEDLKKNNGNTVKAIIEDDGKIHTIYVIESKIAAVTAVNSDKVTLNNRVGTIDIDENDVYSGIARGDVVNVTTLYHTDASNDDAYSIVTKAEVITGTVTGYKGTENVVLDGTTYKVYNKTGMLNAIPNVDVTESFDSDDIGETFDLYLVNGYVGAAVLTSETANNYSLVTAVRVGGKVNGGFTNLDIKVLAADGTVNTITANDSSKQANGQDLTDAAQLSAGDIIVWSGSASSANVTVKAQYKTGGANYGSFGANAYDSTKKTFNSKALASNCVLFAQTAGTVLTQGQPEGASNAKFRAYDMRTLGDTPKSGSVNGTYVTNSSGEVVAVFLALGTTPSGGNGNTVYGIVSSYSGMRKAPDDSNKYFYTVQSNGETYDLYVNGNTKLTADSGQLVSFSPASDSIYNESDIDVWTAAAAYANAGDASKLFGAYANRYYESDKNLAFYKTVASTDAGYIGADGDTLHLANDCAIVYVDMDAKTSSGAASIDEFDSVTGYQNIAFHKDNDGDIDVLFVETSNERGILSRAGEAVQAPKLDINNVQKALPANGGSTTQSTPTSLSTAMESAESFTAPAGTILTDENGNTLYPMDTSKTDIGDTTSDSWKVASLHYDVANGDTYKIERYHDRSFTSKAYESSVKMAADDKGADFALLLGNKQNAYFKIIINRTGTRTSVTDTYYYSWTPMATDTGSGGSASGGGTTEYTVNTPAAITVADGHGAYTATVSPATAAAEAPITVTVKCTTAPVSGTDTITLAGTGVTPSGTVTFGTGDASAEKTITFDMPAANVADLAISAVNAGGSTPGKSDPTAPVVKIASAGEKGVTLSETALKAASETNDDITVNDFANGSKDCVKFTIDNTANANSTTEIKLKVGAGAAGAYTSGVAQDLGDTLDSDGVPLVLTVKVSGDAFNETTFTYTVKVKAALKDVNAPTVTLEKGTTNGVSSGLDSAVTLKEKSDKTGSNADTEIGWTTSTNDTVKFTVTDADANHGTRTVTLQVGTAEAVEYTSEDDVILADPTSAGVKLTLTVTYAATKVYNEATFTYEITLKTGATG